MSILPRNTRLSVLFIVLSLVVVACVMMRADFSARASEASAAAIQPQPVDDSMHHFMEYVFEPNYKRLRVSMADEPADKQVWKAIKGDALTLAESANLLLMRTPEEDADTWRELSATVRGHGSDLYQAARKSDYAAASKAYTTMLKSCNACHDHFADGEHQLEP